METINHTKRCLILFYSLLLIFLVLGIFGTKVHAASQNTSELSFEVIPVTPPEHQIEGVSSYYYLKVVPNQKQTLQVKIKNRTDETGDFLIQLNRGNTSNSGHLDYSQHGQKKDSSLEYDFEKITRLSKKQVEISGNSEQIINFEYTIPKESFKGVILGGIYVTKKPSKSTIEKEKNTMIRNRAAYGIPIVFQETFPYVGKKTLKLKKVIPGLNNYHSALQVNLQNPTSSILDNLKIKVTVYKDDIKDVYRSQTSEQLSMAPNSNFDYQVDWADQAFKPGKYTLHLTAQADDEKWQFKKQFTIKNADAKNIEKERVSYQETESNQKFYWIIGGLCLLVTSLAGILLYFYRKRKQ